LNLLRPNDLARRLAVSRAWVYEAAKSGRIPSVRIGGVDGPLRFVPDDIERWLAEARSAWVPGRAADGGIAPPGATPRHRQLRQRRPVGPQDLLDVLDRNHCSRQGRGCPGYGLLGGYRACGEDVALEVAVVALGGADVGVAKLPLDAHQRIPARDMASAERASAPSTRRRSPSCGVPRRARPARSAAGERRAPRAR
jgi:excisionase family DNA binding protein